MKRRLVGLRSTVNPDNCLPLLRKYKLLAYLKHMAIMTIHTKILIRYTVMNNDRHVEKENGSKL